ncbi:hypothetical protein BJ970_006918 [Saccharopolyspora phatthalungensis]|uniref:Immunity protein Imm1 n=1 Tax=Saccharopolyspora phatthalungensis TaxID=664693 RepID=A0A840QJN4_9PSEU|nr:hypothetical protein [Saccharopolyspora phatthalungensis]
MSAVIDKTVRHAYTAGECTELVRAAVRDVHLDFSSKFYVWDRPCGDGDNDELPPSQLRIATDPVAGYGALNWAGFEGSEDDGCFDSCTESPPANPPRIRFDIQSDYYFPADTLLPLDVIQDALFEYCRTGRRPSNVQWQEGPYY